MPIYEYRCNDCGHQFEVSQRMSDEPVRVCEVCGGEVARVLFAPAIHFKGSGFYNTAYGRRRAGKDSADGAAPAGDAAKKDGDGGGDGQKKVKEATPKDTAARATGP